MAITDPRERGRGRQTKKIITRKFNYTMDQLFLDKVCKLVKLRKKKTTDFFVLLP